MDLTEPPSALSGEEWALVHNLRLRGLVRVEDKSYERLVVLELVAARGDFVALTEAGRTTHASWARYADGSAPHKAALVFFEGFDDLNRELLAVCTAWQVHPGGVPNDHKDVEYDWQIIGRLERLHERTAPRVRRLARDATRFSSYDAAFRSALKNVRDDGAHEWFTSPSIDSFHTLWNRLHEDLLLALGIERQA